MTTTPETIAELRKLLAEATQGEWHCRHWHTDDLTVVHVGTFNLATMTTEDGDLTTAAVNALPSLLSDLEAAQKREQVLREALVSIEEYWNRDENDGAMANACYHAIDTARAALAATEVK